MKKIVVLLLLGLTNSILLGSLVDLNNGIVNTIDSETNDSYRLDYLESPVIGTTLEVLSNGIVNDITGTRNSNIIIDGGTVNGEYITLMGNASLEVRGGNLNGVMCYSASTNTVISGGTFNHHVHLNGLANIEAGIFKAGFSSLGATSIKGGIFENNSIGTQLGGIISIYGNFDNYGTFFDLDITDSESTIVHLVGNLQNGDAIDLDVYIEGEGSQLVVVPEPASLLICSAGLLILKRRK